MERGTVKALRATLPETLTIDALKTVAYFTRVLRRAVLNFYRMDIDAFDFIDIMARLIEDQFTRAWNQGARAVGFDPAQMTAADQAELMAKINAQADHVLNFAQDIENASIQNTSIEPLYARVDLWANRYDEVVNDAKIYFAKRSPEEIRLVWRLGATERHCSTCAALDGIVATAAEWEASGYRPQHAPNPLLECGGWRCDCRLEQTDAELTPGGIVLGV